MFKTMSQLDLLQKRLFGAGNIEAQNIKVYPGSSRDVGTEQLAAEINKSITRIANRDFEEIDFDSAEY